MIEFKNYLDAIKDEKTKEKMTHLLEWVISEYPNLDRKIAWNQPHFVHKDTFIIGFVHTKQHVSVAPEYKAIEVFKEKIKDSGYIATNFIFKIKWNQHMNYDLLMQIIDYNIKDKSGTTTYWRKSNK